MVETDRHDDPIARMASAVGEAASDKVNEARSAVARIAGAKEEKQVEKQLPRVKAARAQLAGTAADRVLDSLGDSPLALTGSLDGRVKSSFPVPKEQTVLWADAEFDLRPSGIVATDKGVFVKSDASAISIGKRKRRASRLTYLPWEYFEPSFFSAEGGEDFLSGVDPACTEAFASACRAISSTGTKLAASDVDGALRTAEGPEGGRAAAITGGAAALSAESAVFVEQRAAVNNPAGHGEMVEEAINLLDRLSGLDAKVVGRDNAKNGADRIVEGVSVQTKFYNTARGSLEACFDPASGRYRYIGPDGKLMQLEVPGDQYGRVLAGFKRKIAQGKVPGVTDPEKAVAIVRKGRLTYDQAVNLTKPGTVESLAFDAGTGAVICSCAFGISFVAATFSAYRSTSDRSESVRAGVAAGIQVFGASFAQHVIVSQLSRTGLSNALMTPSRIVVEGIGTKASQTIVNGLRALSGKSALSGAAATKHLAKILRSNAVTAAATFAVFAVPETYRLVSGRASGAQYAKNIASLAGSIAGGIGGSVAAGVAAAKVGGLAGTGITPGVGTAVGIAGGFVGGAVGSTVVGAVGGVLHEGDTATFGRYLNAMVSCVAVEYLLDEAEIDALMGRLDATGTAELKRLMDAFFSADKQEAVVRAFLAPLCDEVVSGRDRFLLPSEDEVAEALIALEDDAEEA